MQYFPLFITWIMLCVIIYQNISHHLSNTLYWIHFRCLYTARHILASAPFSGATSTSAIGRVTRSYQVENPGFADVRARIAPFGVGKARCLSSRQVHEKLMQFTLTRAKVFLLFKSRQQAHKGVSAVLEHQIKALQEDIPVCQSRLTFKGPMYDYRSHFVWEYKGKQVIKRKALKNGETDIPFQVQFSPATVFATYHSDERVALKWLNRVPRRRSESSF